MICSSGTDVSKSLYVYTLYTLSISVTMSVAGPSSRPVQAFYCAICILPTEYCEFGPSVSKCKTWLESNDKAEYERVWGEGENSTALGAPFFVH